MHVYKRKTGLTLWVLRTLCIVSIAFCIYFFRQGFENYGYLLVIILLFSCIYSITALRIDRETLTIRQFYCLGWVWRSWSFKSDAMEITPFEMELTYDYDMVTDTWWDLLLIFVPAPKGRLLRYKIRQTDITGQVREVKMKLEKGEYERILKFSTTETSACL
jgi:hypothetical protein